MANLLSKNYLPPANNTGFSTKEWTIHLVFYNLTFAPPAPNNDDDVVNWCNTQLDAVGAIWCTKGALNFIVNPALQPRPAPVAGTDFSYDAAAALPPSSIGNGVKWHRVYVVNRIIGSGAGQGLTFRSGTSEAYTLLDVRAIDDLDHGFIANRFKNPFILAHELGHMMGLNHPQEAWGFHSIPSNENRQTIMNRGVPSLNVLTARELLAFNEKTKLWYTNLKNALTPEQQEKLNLFQFLVSASMGAPSAFFSPDP